MPYYSIVNPQSQVQRTSNTLVRYASSTNFASLMYAHYQNCCDILNLNPWHQIRVQPVVYCVTSVPEGSWVDDLKTRPEPACSARTVYFAWPKHREWQRENGMPLPYDLNFLWGTLHAMTRFTQAYKQYEGSKLTLTKEEPSLEPEWRWIPPALNLNIHKYTHTNLLMQVTDEKICP